MVEICPPLSLGDPQWETGLCNIELVAELSECKCVSYCNRILPIFLFSCADEQAEDVKEVMHGMERRDGGQHGCDDMV